MQTPTRADAADVEFRAAFSATYPELVRYASCFAAMLMGEALLRDLGVPLERLDHRQFPAARQLIETRGEQYFDHAIAALQLALRRLYGDQSLSLLRLSATFRRGDLLQVLATPSPG